jgi:Phospholipase_D-nuclease N-terminal
MTTDLTPYIPILIPLVILELTLMIVALVHVLTHSTYKAGNRVMWVLIVVLINIIGPVLYFVLGRSDNE